MREFAENHLQNDAYFNSGILLMNLKNMAKNQQLLLDVKVPLKYPDQDILNVGPRTNKIITNTFHMICIQCSINTVRH